MHAILLRILIAFFTPSTIPSTAPSEFDARLLAIDQRAGAIHDLTADFVQEKKSPLLRKPIISRGNVRAKEGAALWETDSPDHTFMSIDPTTLRLFYVKQKTVEEYPIQGQLGMMAASPLPRLAAIRKSFSVQPDDGAGLSGNGTEQTVTFAIRLTPTDDSIRPYLNYVRVLLDETRGTAVAFEMVDPDGELTVIHFSNLKIDPKLSPDAFILKLPGDVKIVRPLEGIAAPGLGK